MEQVERSGRLVRAENEWVWDADGVENVDATGRDPVAFSSWQRRGSPAGQVKTAVMAFPSRRYREFGWGLANPEARSSRSSCVPAQERVIRSC